MSDLISRSALLKCFSITKDGHKIPEKDCDNFEVTMSIKDIKTIIKNQPTAYNVDEVVKQMYAKDEDIGDCKIWLQDAEEIVRKGGVNE